MSKPSLLSPTDTPCHFGEIAQKYFSVTMDTFFIFGVVYAKLFFLLLPFPRNDLSNQSMERKEVSTRSWLHIFCHFLLLIGVPRPVKPKTMPIFGINIFSQRILFFYCNFRKTKSNFVLKNLQLNVIFF